LEKPTASGQAINPTPLLDIMHDLIHDIFFDLVNVGGFHP
jgi:hypothetical protein